jgi:lon-related putative ATP-dependent protease
LTLKRALTAEQLRFTCNADELGFNTTAELLPCKNIIGQKRAEKAMEFGLLVKHDGYNIFVAGAAGTGKRSYTLEAVRKIAEKEPAPDDWLYVYNFENDNEPLALNLPAGWGSKFKMEIEELLTELRELIPKAFSSEEYERQKAAYFKKLQEMRASLLEKLNQKAEEEGFVLKKTSGGFITVPVIDGKEISDEEYNNLDNETRELFERKSTEIQLKAMDIIRRIQKVEKEVKAKVKKLDRQTALMQTGDLFENLQQKYKEFPRIIRYLQLFQEDVLDNLDYFRSEDEDGTAGLPWLQRQKIEQHSRRYAINLIVDNKEAQGAPVVMETNPTYYNLIGRMEYENHFGTLATDFTMITAGALHRANGGYLILQVRDLLQNLQAWGTLKRVLKTKETKIENLGEQLALFAVTNIKAEPIPIKVKVILIGSPLYYHLLYNLDEDFRKLFKIKVDFSTEMERNQENIKQLCGFIAEVCQRKGMRHFHKEAVAEVIEYIARLTGDQQKLSLSFNEILELIYEAEAWAKLEGRELVYKNHVQQAVKAKEYRSDKYKEQLLEMISRGQILIDVDGETVGQVNGLAVIDLGEYRFGRPYRITASAFAGRHGIINIERESEMSGKIHDKGVLILSGYLGQKYARLMPLTLSASICFEQQYHGVDGDSASGAELYALASALSGLPVQQGIAVTGSVNQKGDFQPVGGVTEKIEGFFFTCKIKGLTGRQGVIIPEGNISNLMLSPEVIEAVEKGDFKIYPIKHITEGFEILFGCTPDIVDQRIIKTLKHFNELTEGDKKEEAVEGDN